LFLFWGVGEVGGRYFFNVVNVVNMLGGKKEGGGFDGREGEVCGLHWTLDSDEWMYT